MFGRELKKIMSILHHAQKIGNISLCRRSISSHADFADFFFSGPKRNVSNEFSSINTSIRPQSPRILRLPSILEGALSLVNDIRSERGERETREARLNWDRGNSLHPQTAPPSLAAAIYGLGKSKAIKRFVLHVMLLLLPASSKLL